jgi:hypothetical protein
MLFCLFFGGVKLVFNDGSCILIYRNCTFLFTNYGTLLFTDYRHHSFIGYEKETAAHKDDKIELIHKYTSTPWIQIEAGMAYQAGLPLLILKEKKVYAEGILDPNNSDSYIFEFEIEKNYKKLSAEMEKIIESWIKEI